MDPFAAKVASLDRVVKRRAVLWIWLGVYALFSAGVLSLLLVVARTPGLQNLLPGTDFFHVALVVHVDLSVLVWFLSCAGLAWTLFDPGGAKGARHQMPHAAFGAWHLLPLVLAIIGTFMISVAPFVGADQPLMNNYVPVLQHPWFYVALGVVGTAVVLQAAVYLCGMRWRAPISDEIDMVQWALAVAAVCAIAAVVCVAWTYWQMPDTLTGQYRFEVLFWGGGHVLQFTNTVLVLVAWLLLARSAGGRLSIPPRTGVWLFAALAMPLLAVPAIYADGVASEATRHGFTQLMRWGGLATLPLGAIVLGALINRGAGGIDAKLLRAVVVCSMSLFAAGGVIGFLINGSNTMIPAHYHGSIVGVTLAFMGVVYFALPRLGYAIRHARLLAAQPYVYAGGQLLHISGLAMSGGYGVQRKVAGAEQALDGVAQTLGMGMMGLGGLLAALGGLCFLVVAVGALRNGMRSTASHVTADAALRLAVRA